MSSSEYLLDKARQLPAGVLRLLEYADALQPTTILICDCDARPIGQSLEYLAAAKAVELPSADGALHYRKVSRRTSPARLQAHLADFFEHTAELAGAEKPSILVVDDHISSGGTLQNFRKTLKNSGLDAEVRWATYTGRGTDFSAFPHIGPSALMPWRDRPDVIGISYDEALQPVEHATERSREFYTAIAEGAHMAVQQTALI